MIAKYKHIIWDWDGTHVERSVDILNNILICGVPVPDSLGEVNSYV